MMKVGYLLIRLKELLTKPVIDDKALIKYVCKLVKRCETLVVPVTLLLLSLKFLGPAFTAATWLNCLSVEY